MQAIQPLKKDGQDWSPSVIKCALGERRLSLRALSIRNGYSPNTLANVLRMPWPKAEKIVADAIGVKPETIWPTRYAWRNSKPVIAPLAAA